MSLELQVLRTAKAAVDEGLMQASDYNVVKEAFMKALAIKGGVDSGFLGQADFAEARKEFFQSLGMAGMGGMAAAPQSCAQQEPVAAAPQPSGTPTQNGNAIAAPRTAAQPTNGVSGDSTPPASRGSPRPRQAVPEISIPEQNNQPSAAVTPTGTDSTTPKSAVGTPSRISNRGGGAAAVASKKSMSGISIHADSVNIVWELRVKKAYQWVMFQISGTGKEVVIESAAQPNSTWQEFVAAVPQSQCRYGVFDYKYVNSEGTEFGKLVFLSWAPADAPTKAKMQHASTKDLFRGLLEGVSVELHATDVADLSESVVREQVASTVKIK